MLPRLFEGQMRYLKNHYRVLSLAEACRELESPASAAPAVVVTFDDGYRDLYLQAFPILQRYNIPATIYLIAGSIESGRPAWYDRIFLALKHAPGPNLEVDLGDAKSRRYVLDDDATRFRAALEIIIALRAMPDTARQELCAALETQIQLPPDRLANRMLDWDKIRLMQRAGMFFGCHTMTHAAVSRLDSPGREREIVDSKKLIESRIEVEIRDFAYPFGKPEDCGTEATQILSREGYRSAVTTCDGVNVYGADPFKLFRINAGDERSLAMFAARLNWAFLRAEPLAEGEASKPQKCSQEPTAPHPERPVR
jgi:peptidoglycan/xylan/chitin deacetylase (PgdA/CDA1 family)